jgi:hypothetical protein
MSVSSTSTLATPRARYAALPGLDDESTSSSPFLVEKHPQQGKPKAPGPLSRKRWARHPFAPIHFERPEWGNILALLIFCILSYPFLLLCTILAQKQTLTIARAIVGFGCTVVGLCVGPSLMDLGRRFLEAAGTSVFYASWPRLTRTLLSSLGNCDTSIPWF